MSAVRPDFEILVERADEYAAHWARRKFGRFASGRTPPREWPGTIDEARKVVDAFAGLTAFADRERLATIVQHSARGMWVDTVRAARARSREMR